MSYNHCNTKGRNIIDKIFLCSLMKMFFKLFNNLSIRPLYLFSALVIKYMNAYMNFTDLFKGFMTKLDNKLFRNVLA